MATNTFHLFPTLPKELRDLIWFFAIQPAKPSARFIYDPWKYGYPKIYTHEPPQEDENTLAPNKCHLAIKQRPHFWDEPPSTFWAMSNPSAYLLNKELWVTCKESHEAMKRCFDILRHPSAAPTGPNHTSHPAHNRDTVSLPNLYLNKKWQSLVIFPADDLICYDLDFWDPDWESFQEMAEMLYATCRRVNLAFWFGISVTGAFYPADDPWVDFLKNLTAHMSHCVRAVWLIDDGLERRGLKASKSGQGSEFYGENCRFVEVHHNDTSWEGYIEAVETFYHVWDVIEWAEEYTREIGPDGKLKQRPTFGILARELLR